MKEMDFGANDVQIHEPIETSVHNPLGTMGQGLMGLVREHSVFFNGGSGTSRSSDEPNPQPQPKPKPREVTKPIPKSQNGSGPS